MVSSALLFALVAGLYPLGLAIVLRYLGEPPSLRHAFAYLAGTATVTLVAGIAILLVLRGSGLTERQHPAPSGGIQVFLGVALLYLTFLLVRRRNRAGVDGPERSDEEANGEKDGAHGHLRLGRVFALGLVTYLPSLLYVSSIKNLSDANLSTSTVVLALLLCAVLVLQMVEIPIILRLLAPERTGPILASYNAWMHRHGRDLVILLSAAGGVYMLVKGIVSLLD